MVGTIAVGLNLCRELKMSRECSLVTRTRELYVARPREVTQLKIAADTGLSIHWINQFAMQRDHEPGVNKVQTLYEYLAGKKLEV